MEGKFDEKIKQLSESEQKTARGAKTFFFSAYNNYLKPILIAVFLFWTFDKVKNVVGIQEAVFIQITTIIVFLRMIVSKMR